MKFETKQTFCLPNCEILFQRSAGLDVNDLSAPGRMRGERMLRLKTQNAMHPWVKRSYRHPSSGLRTDQYARRRLQSSPPTSINRKSLRNDQSPSKKQILKRRVLRSIKAALSPLTLFLSPSQLPRTLYEILVARQFFQTHRTARVEPIGADSDLRSKTELAAIVEPG